jgi:hypothetical protein
METKYIFVLAGGLDEKGEVHNFVKVRLDKCIELYYTSIINANYKIIVFGGGTYHKPPILNTNGYVIHESTACAKYLIDKGIPAENIFREWSSYDTLANGYYAFINFIIPLNIGDIILITSKFHMLRTKQIFNYFIKIFKKEVVITYIETNNSEIDINALEIRNKREHETIKKYNDNIINTYNTVEDFTIWFYTQHNAYKSLINYEINNKINKSY